MQNPQNKKQKSKKINKLEEEHQTSNIKSIEKSEGIETNLKSGEYSHHRSYEEEDSQIQQRMKKLKGKVSQKERNGRMRKYVGKICFKI